MRSRKGMSHAAKRYIDNKRDVDNKLDDDISKESEEESNKKQLVNINPRKSNVELSIDITRTPERVVTTTPDYDRDRRGYQQPIDVSRRTSCTSQVCYY